MTDIDVYALAELMRDAAGAEIMPRFRRLGAGDVRVKTEATDLVTEADEQAERMMRAHMPAILPGALFVGEESVAADPALLAQLDGADLAVIVDPVDGTSNFAAGLPLFGVMASIVVKGEAVAGIIYDPLADDFVMAEKGGGAFTRRSDGTEERIGVAAPVPMARMQGTASVSSLDADIKPLALQNLAKVRASSSFRCAAHEYRLMAGGHIHFAMFRKLLPWDHVAGVLIAQEAGAHVARLDGSAYRPEHRKGGLLAATDIDSWTALRDEVFPFSM